MASQDIADYLAAGTGDRGWFRVLLRAQTPRTVAVAGRDGQRPYMDLSAGASEGHNAHSCVVPAVAREPRHHEPVPDPDRVAMESGAGTSDADMDCPETAKSAVRYDELGGVLRPLSDLRCFVCDHVMSEGEGVLDGRVHRIGLAQSGTNAGSWIWGPVAVHIECLENLVIPTDDVVVSDYETRIDTVPYDWALQTCTKRSQ